MKYSFLSIFLTLIMIGQIFGPSVFMTKADLSNPGVLAVHSTIHINGDGQFSAANGVVAGSGTSADPYIIENWSIDATNKQGIWIENTNKFYIIRNCHVFNGTNQSKDHDAIHLDNSRNGTIRDNRLHDSWFGIFVTSSKFVTILNNSIYSNIYGIFETSSSNLTVEKNEIKIHRIYHDSKGIYFTSVQSGKIENNTISNNSMGIHIDGSTNIIIENNNISNNSNGTYIGYSTNLFFYSNKFWDNEYHLCIVSGSLTAYPNAMPTNNTVNGKPMYYYRDQSDITVPSDAGYVALINCSRMTVKDLKLSHNYDGILLSYTKDSLIRNNTLELNYYGIHFDTYETNNIVADNTIKNNTYGIFIYFSWQNKLYSNKMANNSYSFGIDAGNNDKYYFNNTIPTNNTVDGKPVYFWTGESNKVAPSDAGFLGLIDCSNITVKNMTMKKNYHSILLVDTHSSSIYNSNFSHNYFGIDQRNGYENRMYNNTYTFNDRGCQISHNGMTGTNNISVENSTFSFNSIGAYLYSANPNNVIFVSIENNSFINNSVGITGLGVEKSRIFKNIFRNNTNGLELQNAKENKVHLNNWFSTVSSG